MALVISVSAGVVSPFLFSHGIGWLYERTGRLRSVSALTGLCYFPGIVILDALFNWFVQTTTHWTTTGAASAPAEHPDHPRVQVTQGQGASLPGSRPSPLSASSSRMSSARDEMSSLLNTLRRW